MVLQMLVTFSPELLLAVASCCWLIVGILRKKEPFAFLWGPTVVVLLLAAVAVFFIGQDAPGAPRFLAFDSFARFTKIIILLSAAVCVLLASTFFKQERTRRFEYLVLCLLASFGMLVMCGADDLLSMYIGIEMFSLPAYIMAAIDVKSRRSCEAGLKYFILGALSSCLLLYGCSLIYGFTGTTDFHDIYFSLGASQPSVGLGIGLAFVLAGLGFKVSAAPFHMWAPDVYEGAPTPVTAFFATAPKLAALALLSRFVMTAFALEHVDQWQPIVIVLAALSMLVGALGAMWQNSLKRLIAYSSIGHMGFALMGVASGTQAGAAAMLNYMTFYLIMTLGFFAALLACVKKTGMSEKIEDLRGLGGYNKPLAMAFSMYLFSFFGLPPLLGFVGKFYVFTAALDANLEGLVVVAALASAISAYYYLMIIRRLWFDEGQGVILASYTRVQRVTLSVTFLLVLLGALPFFLRPVVMAGEKAALALF